MKRRKRKSRSRSWQPAHLWGIVGVILLLTALFGLSELGRWLSGSSNDWHSLQTGSMAVASMTVFTIGSYYGIRNYRRMIRLRALRLSDVDRMNGTRFENYVAQLIQKQGYTVQPAEVVDAPGIDLIAQANGQRIAIQVKRYREPLSRRAVADAVAGCIHYGCTAAWVVTNSHFTTGARQLAETTGCRLIEREELTDWIVAFSNRMAA